MSTDQEDLRKIIESFKDASKKDFWRLPTTISTLSGVSQLVVDNVIQDANNFYRSLNAEGKPVYTTKDLYRKFQTFGSKVIAAFKNRID